MEHADRAGCLLPGALNGKMPIFTDFLREKHTLSEKLNCVAFHKLSNEWLVISVASSVLLQ